jgi:hypothetical protein
MFPAQSAPTTVHAAAAAAATLSPSSAHAKASENGSVTWSCLNNRAYAPSPLPLNSAAIPDSGLRNIIRFLARPTHAQCAGDGVAWTGDLVHLRPMRGQNPRRNPDQADRDGNVRGK